MARKRKRDKEDEELAREIAEVAGVTRYMQQVTEEEIKKKGDLYLKYAVGMAGFGLPVLQNDTKTKEDVEEKTSTAEILNPQTNQTTEEKLSTEGILNYESSIGTGEKQVEKTNTPAILNPQADKTTEEKTSIPVILNPEPLKETEEKQTEKTSTPAILNPQADETAENKTSTPVILVPEEKNGKTSITSILNKLSIPAILISNSKNEKLSIPAILNRFSLSTAMRLNRLFPNVPLSTLGILNLQPVKVHFEQEHLIRFIYGAYNIIYYPHMIDHRIKIILLAALLKATCEKTTVTKIKTNDLLRSIHVSKSFQKEIPQLVESTGLAKVKVRKKGGTEITFSEEIFNPYGKNGSNGLVSLFVINNILTTITYDEGKVEEKKLIPLTEIGKYTSLISLYLAGFPLSAATSNLIETIKGKDTELVTAFWIQANLNSTKIKSPSAYLIKVLKDGDPGHISGEIMEKAKVCVKAAQTIVHENYDEPELGFLKNLAQRLSLVDAYYKDRASLTAELRTAGRKLIDECEKVLNKLPTAEKQH
jgi:hypothetical protein